MINKRLFRLILLLRCCLFFLVRGRATKVPKNIKKIIVVPTGKLGDVVCATPVLKAVRKNYPDAKIIVGGTSRLYRAVLADSGLADDYIDLESDNSINQIKETEAEVALVTGPTFEWTAFLFLGGIPFIVSPVVKGGLSPLVTRPYKILCKFITTFEYKMRTYAPRERLRVLEPLGIFFDDTKKILGYSKKAGEKIEQLFNEYNILKNDFVVGITPTAGHKIKEWPSERFSEVADYLISRHKAKILMVGGPNDKEIVSKTIKKVNGRTIPVTDLSIDELKALISKLNLFISVDTGPIYIAEAFNIPTVDITGPIDENEQPPQGPLHLNVVPAQRGSPQLFVLNAKSYNREEAIGQILSISVSQVITTVDSLIKNIKK